MSKRTKTRTTKVEPGQLHTLNRAERRALIRRMAAVMPPTAPHRKAPRGDSPPPHRPSPMPVV